MTPQEKFQRDYHHKKILVLGLGLQGRSVGDAQIFAQIGAQVKISDLKTEAQLKESLAKLRAYPITYTLGKHLETDIDWADVILRNPSVPWNSPFLLRARSQNKEIVMDESLFFRYAKSDKIIGITGTRGKSTTTQLIYRLLVDHQLPAVLAGNISPQPALSLLESYKTDNWYVFELSSWQLQGLDQEKISPHIAVLTNVYPDHLLDRDFEAYAQDKATIFRHQKSPDHLVVNADNSTAYTLSQAAKSQVHLFKAADVAEVSTPLVGSHNRENIAAAYQVARLLNLAEPQKTIAQFNGMPFRLEKIASINGVNIINDTTSTTPIATIKAVQAYPQSIMIVGGTTKKLPVDELIHTLNQTTKKIVLISGSGTDEIKSHLRSELVVGEYNQLEAAIMAAWKTAQPGDHIVFSPGFTSFGLFINEFDRGEKFNQLISGLTKKYATP